MKQLISEGERERRARQSATDKQSAQHNRRAFGIARFCERYGVGRTRAYEEIKLGRLRIRKCGRKTLITEDDAEDWLGSLPTVPDAGA